MKYIFQMTLEKSRS